MIRRYIYRLPILLCLLLLCAGCGRDSDAPNEDVENAVSLPTTVVSYDSETPLESLRQAAENEQTDAQRELAKRLLFGDGVDANPTESIQWARRAAINGDELASLWTGRASLNEPVDRIEAGAWFLIAQVAHDASVREDAFGELDALDLKEDEHSSALARAERLRAVIRTRLE